MKSELKECRKVATVINEDVQKRQKEFEMANRPYSVKKDAIPSIIANGIISVILFFLIKWWVKSGFSFWVGLITIPVSLIGIFFFIVIVDIGPRSYHNKELYAKKKGIEEKQTELCQIRAQIKKTEEEIAQTEKQIYIEENQKKANDEIIKKNTKNFMNLIRMRERN